MDANLKRRDSHDLSQGSIYEWIGEKPPTLQQAQSVVGGLVQLLTHVNGDQVWGAFISRAVSSARVPGKASD